MHVEAYNQGERKLRLTVRDMNDQGKYVLAGAEIEAHTVRGMEIVAVKGKGHVTWTAASDDDQPPATKSGEETLDADGPSFNVDVWARPAG
jgi:hypothetical protein